MKKYILLIMLSILSASLWAQQTVTGTVTSSDDRSGLPGVSIIEKGTSNGTITEMDGSFSLTVREDATLTFSFVGYLPREIEVNGRTRLDVELILDVTELSEVVVIGYGQVQKEDLTGAVAKVSSKDFNRGVLTSPQDLLIGKIAGVQVTNNSGAPGAGATIRIRGGSSLSASNDPLIVIDGLPIDNTNVSGISNPLATINPNDIESFTVLKDASATAIYGARASNGVIIITTKKGQKGKPTFAYDTRVSISQPIDYVDVLDGDEYRELVTSLHEQGFSGINQAAVDLLGDENTNWQKEIFRMAISHDHNLSAAGAVFDVPFRVAYGYTDQQGILKTTHTKRHSISLNANPTFFDDALKVTISAKQTMANTSFGDEGAVGAAVTYDPTQPIYSDNTQFGGFFTFMDGTRPNTFVSNPVALLELRENTADVNRFMGNIQLDYTFPFLPAVSANLNLGIDRSSTEGIDDALPGTTWIYRDLADDLAQTGRLLDYDAHNSNELLDFYLKYEKEIGNNRIQLTGGYSWQHFLLENSTYSRSGDESFVIDDLESKNESYLISFFGRLNYIYNDKYLFTATLRNDGSSRFTGDNQWGLFPSLALGWRLSEEAFMSGVGFISDLKIRAGYGITGQQDLGSDVSNRYYPALAIYRRSIGGASYQFGNEFVQTLRPDPYDANIKWEETTTYNIGIDFGLWSDRVYGSVELYQRETENLINTIPIAGGSNFSNFLTTNVGNLENRGVEVTLNAIPVFSNEFTWNAGINFTRNINEITKLTLIDDPDYPGVNVGAISGGVGNTIQKHAVGQSAFTYFLFQQVYNPQGAPVEGLYVNRTGEPGELTSDLNKYYLKNPMPDWTLGVNSRLNYKKLDFSFSGRLSINNYVYNNVQSAGALRDLYLNSGGGYFTNIPSDAANLGFVNPQYWSDYYLENASFFKMDNISLGYTLDQLLMDRLQARISFTVQNAFIITDYSGIDPEVNGGIDNNIYPRPRTYLMGLNINF